MASLATLMRSIRAAAKANRSAAQCKTLLVTLEGSFAALSRADRELLLMTATIGDGWDSRPGVPVVAWLLRNGVSPDAKLNGNNAYPKRTGTPLLSVLSSSLRHPMWSAVHAPAKVRAHNAQIELGIVAFLDAGANPNVVNHQRITPLHHAADHGAVKALRALLAHGAAIEAKDKQGATALLYAARSNSAEAVKLLLDAGAKLATNRDGDTPYDQAIAYGAPRTAAILAKRSKAPPLAGNTAISAAEITRMLARLATTRHSIRGVSGTADPVVARFVRSGTIEDRRVTLKLDVAKLPKLAPAVKRELIKALGNEAKLWLAEQGVNTSSYDSGPASPWYHTAGSKSTKRAAELFAAMRKR